MGNPIKGETPLVLGDGRAFTLVMDMEALVEAEAAYGKPLATMMSDASKGFVGASRALLYGAMRAKHPAITLRDASGMLVNDSDAVSEALSAAIEAGFDKPSAEGNAPPAKRRGGKTSGASGAKRG